MEPCRHVDSRRQRERPSNARGLDRLLCSAYRARLRVRKVAGKLSVDLSRLDFPVVVALPEYKAPCSWLDVCVMAPHLCHIPGAATAARARRVLSNGDVAAIKRET